MTEPEIAEIVQPSSDRMPSMLARFQTDRQSLERLFPLAYAPERFERFSLFYAEWTAAADAVPCDGLTPSDRADLFLFRNLLVHERVRLDRAKANYTEALDLSPYAPPLLDLESERRKLADLDPIAAADRLSMAEKAIRGLRAELKRQLDEGVGLPSPALAFRAAEVADRFRSFFEGWFAHYSGYDPLFTWWAEKPYRSLDLALSRYARFLRRRVACAQSQDAIVGDPIGRDALVDELARNLIPYTPEELIEIARREREWCLAEARSAAAEMGCSNYMDALERVKQLHEEPGKQTALVRDLAEEAVRYVTENDLVTVPSLAAETWRMEMMPPEKQKVNPFFLGGETIIVSFPTNTMDHDFKRMSLRGNNRHFLRATVQHELIPGHHLQFFSLSRYRPYREIFETPFWIEGWTIHWEFLLYDLGFPRSPEDRIGMLFWRLHRCARVIFSLGFHLGEMTPEECVEMLVEDVGHERENALGEVRRSFGGDYDPLYQCGYLVGGLQVHALYREMVGTGKMTPREFHDRMLRENFMPIAVLRARMMDEPIGPDFKGDWRFYDL